MYRANEEKEVGELIVINTATARCYYTSSIIFIMTVRRA